MRSRLIGIVLIWLVLAGGVRAQAREAPPPRLPGESPRAAQRLAEGQQLVNEGRLSEGIEEFQRLLEEAGDELLPVDAKEPHHLVAVRRLCHQRLAALPPAGLALYRSRVDPLAKKLLEQARGPRDTALLQRIVDDYFCSGPTVQALELLGDLAFEQGDFAAALRFWQLLAPGETRPPLAYPDARIDLAQLRAKQLLARWCLGERQQAETQLADYRQHHGKAAGYLAGQQGNYASILAGLANRIQPAALTDDSRWPTFAGSPTRQRVLAAAPRCQWLAEPWRVKLDAAAAPVPGQVLTPNQTAQTLAYFPAIAQGRVWLPDARGVTAYDLWTGQRLTRWDLGEELNVEVRFDEAAALAQGVRYTLTVDEQRLYVRLGEPALGLPVKRGEVRSGESYLVCLEMQDGDVKPALRWQVKLEPAEEGISSFEGSPVAADGRVFIAWTRTTQARVLTGIDCHDADTGQRRWRQEISEAREASQAARQRQQLLTLAGPNVVCCTHAGVVAALDQRSGRRVWAARYPRRGYVTADGLPSPRDLAPPLHDGGRLFVAPADCDHIRCLEADSGRLLWESRPVEALQLLGVAHDRLIFTTGSAPRGIRAVETTTGLDLRGWLQPDDGHSDLPTLGRGLLAGDKVFWPTVNGWRVLRQADGRPSRDDFVPLAGLPSGNMASAQGCLVVATDRELIGYVAPARFLEPRLKQAAREPHSAEAQLRLGLAAADAGQPALAFQAFTRAAAEPARRLQYLVIADLPASDGNSLLEGSADMFRAELMARQARLLESTDPAAALRAWQRLLGDASLRRETIQHPFPQPAAGLAAERIDALIRKHGRSIYAEYDKQAASVEDLERLWQGFPNALATQKLLQHVAERREKAGHHQAAVEVRRRLRTRLDGEEAAWNLYHLAQAYEQLGHRDAARAAWLRLAREHGHRSMAPIQQQTFARFAANRLGQSNHAAVLPRLKLAEAWHIMLEGERLLWPESAAGHRLDSLYFAADRTLRSRSAATGGIQWTQPTSTVAWLGRHGDLLLAAGPRRVACLDAASGSEVWRIDAGPARFSGFRLVGGQLLFLLDQTRLLAMDIETGRMAWQMESASSEAGLSLQADEEYLQVQPVLGRCCLVDVWNGQSRLTGPLSFIGANRWAHIEPTQVALIDPANGQAAWRILLDRPTSLTGELPQLAAWDGGLLLRVPRNHADDLLRLDPLTGKALWSRPVLGRSFDLRRGSCDGPRLFLPVDQSLQAFSLASGKPLWSATLPPGHWRAEATQDLVLAWPAQARLRMDVVRSHRRLAALDPTTVLPCRGPAGLGHLLAGALNLVLANASPSYFTILAFDPVTGKPLREATLEGTGTLAELRIEAGLAVAATRDGVWVYR